eukprot:EG_transcript_20716
MWQEESVYSLIPRPAEQVIKPPMYRSKHDPLVAPSCSTIALHGTSKLTSNNSGTELAGSSNKKNAATFGKEVAGTVDPHGFLKKSATYTKGSQSRDMAAPLEGKRTFHQSLTKSRPPVPQRSEKPVMGLVTEKNFVVANAIENILAVPKRPPGEGPLPTQGKDFAKVPKYLQRIKNDIAEETAYLQRLNSQKTAAERERLRMMSEEEKAELIAGLKRKWHETHKQYQTLPFSIDTVNKVQRKEALEAEMEQIEKAIDKLSKKNIHVYDDSELW